MHGPGDEGEGYFYNYSDLFLFTFRLPTAEEHPMIIQL